MRTAQELQTDLLSGELAEIRAALDDLSSGRCRPVQFDAAMLPRCRANPEIYWELVALVDQYRRRGQLRDYDFTPLRSLVGKQALSKTVAEVKQLAPARVAAKQSTAAATGGARASWIPVLRHKAVPMPRPHLPAALVGAERCDTVELVADESEDPVARHASSRDEAPVQTPEIAPSPTPYPQVGSVLRNRYVLEQVLGAGGMGTVFRALDRHRAALPEADRYVALKLLHERFVHRPAVVERLRSEYLQTQQLSHSGIVRVFDFDSEGGTPFFTMELLQGELLSHILSRLSPLRLERPVVDAVLVEVASALSYAHDRGTLHADLKPGNIMITARGEVRVLDFGVAAQVRSEPWIDEAGDSFNAATLAYASHERLMGHAPQVRDDVFSFACLTYELLAGSHPFGHVQALEARERGMKPRRIPGVSRRQWRALRQALAWERTARPASITDLVHDLVSDAPVQRLPAPADWQARTAGSRGRGAWVWLGTAAAAAGLAVAGYTYFPEADLQPQLFSVRQQVVEAGAAATTMARTAISAIQHARTAATDQATPLKGRAIAPAVPAQAIPSVSAPPANPPSAPPEGVVSQSARPAPALPVETPLPQPVAARLEMMSETMHIPESEAVARVIVERRGALDGIVTFSWRSAPGTALENDDYAAFGWATETMTAGQSTATLLVPIVRDSEQEETETFYIEITEPQGQARLGAVTRTTVVIEDDDALQLVGR